MPGEVIVRPLHLLLVGDEGSAIWDGDDFAALTPSEVFVRLLRPLLLAGGWGRPVGR